MQDRYKTRIGAKPHPYLTRMIFIHLTKAERSHIESKTFLCGLQTKQGTRVIVDVKHFRAATVGGLVGFIQVEISKLQLLRRSRKKRENRTNKKDKLFHISIYYYR